MINEARQTLGKRIRALRESEGLSLQKFADMVSLNKDYLFDLEKATKSPTLDTLVKISDGFGISLSELFEGIGPNAEPEPEPSSPDSGNDPTTVRYGVMRL